MTTNKTKEIAAPMPRTESQSRISLDISAYKTLMTAVSTSVNANPRRSSISVRRISSVSPPKSSSCVTTFLKRLVASSNLSDSNRAA